MHVISRIGLAFVLLGALACPAMALKKTPGAMPSFESEAEWRDFIKTLQPAYRGGGGGGGGVESVVVSSGPPSPSITNNQEAGVDEGGIVKRHGRYLIVLRRGRLFTVSLAGASLKAVDAINAFAPGVDASEDWYDEMLVSNGRVIVIGYSYARAGTQINRFRIGADGRLTFEDAYQLRASDYYSSRNYASRMIGNRLIVYSARDIDRENAPLPALRRWGGAGDAPDFQPIGNAQNVHVAAGMDPKEARTLHSVVDCDTSQSLMRCKTSSVVGSWGRVFYVAANAVFVHADLDRDFEERKTRPTAMLYRLPLDGSAPSAIGITGMPIDQFSFQADATGLNLFLSSDGYGDGMWASSQPVGPLALARVTLGQFGDGSAQLPPRSYRALPDLDGKYDLHNRFVGNWLIYGRGEGWFGDTMKKSIAVAASTTHQTVRNIALVHGADRIEQMGSDAVLIGGDGKGVHFTTLLLGKDARVGGSYVHNNAAQGETRSHGFFFRPDDGAAAALAGDGMLGLPVARAARPAYRQLFDQSAAVLFLSRKSKQLRRAGELEARQEAAKPDKCVASCADWYGNARPIFIDGRIIALMGYELVEGRRKDGKIVEVRRLNFADGGRTRN